MGGEVVGGEGRCEADRGWMKNVEMMVVWLYMVFFYKYGVRVFASMESMRICVVEKGGSIVRVTVAVRSRFECVFQVHPGSIRQGAKSL